MGIALQHSKGDGNLLIALANHEAGYTVYNHMVSGEDDLPKPKPAPKPVSTKKALNVVDELQSRYVPKIFELPEDEQLNIADGLIALGGELLCRLKD